MSVVSVPDRTVARTAAISIVSIQNAFKTLLLLVGTIGRIYGEEKLVSCVIVLRTSVTFIQLIP